MDAGCRLAGGCGGWQVRLAADSWRLAAGSRQLAAGNWHMAICSWRLAAPSWRLAAGRWRLAAGSWQLAYGRWQLAAGSRWLASGSCLCKRKSHIQDLHKSNAPPFTLSETYRTFAKSLPTWNPHIVSSTRLGGERGLGGWGTEGGGGSSSPDFPHP